MSPAILTLILGLASPFAGDLSDRLTLRRSKPVTMAVIGDTPYGDEQVEDFPSLIDHINADASVQRVVHVGDTKSGSSDCSDAYADFVEASFEQFEDPVIYTPGDNEWTDCHRSKAGKYDPIERLEDIRVRFFPKKTKRTVGPRVFSQARVRGYESFPENLMWVQDSVVFVTAHVVGSNNNLKPWFVDDENDDLVDDPERREAEAFARIEASLFWLNRAFDLAQVRKLKGVVIFSHADMWSPKPAPVDGFYDIIKLMAERSAAFGKPVLNIQGDSHKYIEDKPLQNGDPARGITTAAPNFTRIVVEGSTTREWLRLKVDSKAEKLFAWERVQF